MISKDDLNRNEFEMFFKIRNKFEYCFILLQVYI